MGKQKIFETLIIKHNEKSSEKLFVIHYYKPMDEFTVGDLLKEIGSQMCEEALEKMEIKTRKIYRIENQNTMHGMWYDNESNYKPQIFELCPNSTAKDFPMGYCLDHRKDGKVWYSAGKSKENMHHWFSKQDAETLINNGFTLFEFEVSEWYEKEYEVLFTRESVVSQKEIDINEIWGDKYE